MKGTELSFVSGVSSRIRVQKKPGQRKDAPLAHNTLKAGTWIVCVTSAELRV
jgi:hypothetical protein